MEHLTEIRSNSKWIVMSDDFSIGIGSHSQNPNTTAFRLKKGKIITWDGDSRNGNVWFICHNEDGKEIRGKVESGIITNLINRKVIRLFHNGNGNIVYSGEYLQRLLNN